MPRRATSWSSWACRRKGTSPLTIRDNGPGFDTNNGSTGMGLRTINDYVEAVGGSCVVESSPGKGTAVSARFRLDVAGQEAG